MLSDGRGRRFQNEIGISKGVATFEGVRDWKGSAPANESALAQRMIDTLKAYVSQTRQLSLF